MKLIRYYRTPALTFADQSRLTQRLAPVLAQLSLDLKSFETEGCFYLELANPLSETQQEIAQWLLAETFEPDQFGESSFLRVADDPSKVLVEIGPRLNFSTAWSTNACSIFRACGLSGLGRIERSRRFLFSFSGAVPERITLEREFFPLLYDRMTECEYTEPLESFEIDFETEPVREVPILEEGISALQEVNTRMGLGMDEWDLDYYYRLFSEKVGRNPTTVECFDLAQSNSEHSRHWFFKGDLSVDGKPVGENLMDIVRAPLEKSNPNSVIAFHDNSSAIEGFETEAFLPERVGAPSLMKPTKQQRHHIFTAETHNFPTGVAPFPGAETGTGGRIRDVHAAGRGSHVVAGTAGYSVGNLRIPNYDLPWEDEAFQYPTNLATPLEIEVEASNGASDYGNKFGEPLIQGFTRSFGQRLPDGSRSEYVKPIMFSGGVGQIDSEQVTKGEAETGMLVVKVGGPAYRIGMGGGAASSMIQGDNAAELDFNAVQRGDAEMEQKLNRVVRACIELGGENPIISIHDQGAGGNCNVVKEIIYPAGGRIDIRAVPAGDKTLSVLELWGAEYQENSALLIRPESHAVFESLCGREKVPFAVIGEVSGDGRVIVFDSVDGSTPVDLELDHVLGKMPQKSFTLTRKERETVPLDLPSDVTVSAALERVLRLLSVGSKRFLTSKVDRCVTGLVAQQQCVGPLQLPLSNVAVISQGYFGSTGTAISIGEQPLKGLIDPKAMARLTVGEALSNLIFAPLTAIEDIKCSGNWMWAPKLPGEGALMYDAACALRDVLTEIGMAIDGGKDSLSMASQVPGHESGPVVSPGTLVLSTYCGCPNIERVVTPDMKRAGSSVLLFVDLGGGKNRLGGSAVAQVYDQLGDESPDLEDPAQLKSACTIIQKLIAEEKLLAGHDRSDGGLIVTLLEMAFAGNCGFKVNINSDSLPLEALFSEELGFVLEVSSDDGEQIAQQFSDNGLPVVVIGQTTSKSDISISVNGAACLAADMRDLRAIWEETSFELEKLQSDPEAAAEEQTAIRERTGPHYHLTFEPTPTSSELLFRSVKPKVAVIREEGSNTDREMAAAFYQAGFEAWDVTMSDLQAGRIALDDFQGAAFVGGFSYADVLDSAKGWAGVIRYDSRAHEQFQYFYERTDTFSLGLCNGCQLLALLGWVPGGYLEDTVQPRFIHNRSGRFECRFPTVKIEKSPAMMFAGMEGSQLGVWLAHGEGRAYFPDNSIRDQVLNNNLVPVRYVDDDGQSTTDYPFNPNGSDDGIAGLCSADGRHLAIMPHPERTFLKWQWAWMPEDWKRELPVSPWIKMFQNAYDWVAEA